MICEYCDKEHNGSYASGRFCSKYCARGFSTRSKRKIINKKVSQKLKTREDKFCIVCGEKVSWNNIVGFCKNCRLPARTNSEQVARCRKKRKLRAIEIKGGKCIVCGYNKCLRNMEFHHLNPDEKEISLSSKNMASKNWDAVLEEVKKCVLVCSNCHGEIEDGMILVENYI